MKQLLRLSVTLTFDCEYELTAAEIERARDNVIEALKSNELYPGDDGYTEYIEVGLDWRRRLHCVHPRTMEVE